MSSRAISCARDAGKNLSFSFIINVWKKKVNYVFTFLNINQFISSWIQLLMYCNNSQTMHFRSKSSQKWDHELRVVLQSPAALLSPLFSKITIRIFNSLQSFKHESSLKLKTGSILHKFNRNIMSILVWNTGELENALYNISREK